jgi:D-glycero-alpha-D-manno-heptose-7-phosphate kinase
MIISKTPLRISFFSGGSDLPSFYKQKSGAAISATIDKYIYVSVHSKPKPNII